MSWQTALDSELKIAASFPGNSSKATAGAISASSAGSAVSAIAAARRRPWVQRERCDGATFPTWLEMSLRRRLWNASPSGAAISPLPYQLSPRSWPLPGEPERAGKAGGGGAGVENEIASAARRRKSEAPSARTFRAPAMSTTDVGARQPRAR